MPIPTTRAALVDLVTSSYVKLERDLETVDAETATLPCVDDWSIKDLLAVRDRLRLGVERVLVTIEALDDRGLLEAGVFGWAGKWPIARWISINTARQYTTARTYVRRALR